MLIKTNRRTFHRQVQRSKILSEFFVGALFLMPFVCVKLDMRNFFVFVV